MKAIIYCRVSSQRQVDEGNGLGSQEQRCRVYAQNKNYEVIKVFPDEGVSGGLFERPAMKALISYLDKYPTERFIIIFDDLARLARDLNVHLKLKTELISRGAKLECPNFVFEDTPEGEFIENVLASKAQLDRQQNRRQVIQKMKARLELGYWPFMPPLGLINKKDSIHGKLLTPHEPYATIFKKVIEKYRDGFLLTQQEVMYCLHDEFGAIGFPNRPALSTTQEILENPLYAGYIEYEKWGIPLMKAKHEGFISLETFNLVQERLQGRTKLWKRRDYRIDFPLRPFVLCASCNKPMTASWNKGRSEKYPNYFCRWKQCQYRWKVVRKYKIEGEFEDYLMSVKPLDGVIDLTKDVLQEQWGIRLDQYTFQREAIKKELKDAIEGIEWYSDRVRKTKDEALITTYEEKIKELAGKEKKAKADLAKQSYTAEQFGTASEKVFNTLKNPMSMWKSDDYDDKRTILFMYFEEELKYDYYKGFGTAGLAYPVKLINQIGQAKNTSVEMSGNDPESE